ncbi:MAG: oligosaccharide flippase family protein [Lachnospiraceae bacterium]|nr:oligosaccharide flippase family protein [Lachnospiraceae bacterium]
MHRLFLKYKSLSIQVKATFWFTICNFILKGISFFTVPLFTRLLSTSEYGTVTIYNSYQQIFLIFATFELSLGAYQRGILKFKDSVREFTKSIQYLCTLITIILFVVTWCFKDIFIQLTDTNSFILILMFGYFLMEPAYSCWMNEKRFNYCYMPAVIVTIAFTVITTVGSLLAVFFVEQTAFIRIESMLLLEILFCLPFYLHNINPSGISKKKISEYWTFALKFQLPLVLHSLSYLVLAQADRIMIGAFVGKSEAAIYSVAYGIANVIIIFQTSLNQVLKPWRYKKMENKEYASIKSNTNLMLIFIGAIVIMFILVAPDVMKLLFNSDYYEAVWTIPPITASIFFMFMYSVFTDVESYFSKTRYVMYASVICALTNIILNYFGIQIFGYIACGYTTLLSYILFSALHYFFMCKVCRKENISDPLFNGKIIIALSAILLMIVFGMTMLYQFTYIRYFILLIIVGVIILKRKNIIEILASLRK